MVEINGLSITEDHIEVWSMMNGKITQVKIQDGIFVVRPDSPVDPIKAAKDFMSAYDIGKTALMRKVTAPYLKKEEPQVTKSVNMGKEGEVLARINNIPVYKEYIIGFYRKFPETFVAKDVIEYIASKYKTIVSQTVTNKGRAYVKYLRENGYIEQTEGRGNVGRVYKFIKVPFESEHPAQASFDSVEAKERKLLELKTIRDQ